MRELQQLDQYQLPADWQPGAPWLVRLSWFCLGSPLVATRWLPGSGWRCALLRRFGSQVGLGCRLKPGLRVKVPWRLALGGLLVGYGSRLSSGCTSGHGLCGLASFSRASLLAVIVFMAVAILTAQLVWRLGVRP